MALTNMAGVLYRHSLRKTVPLKRETRSYSVVVVLVVLTIVDDAYAYYLIKQYL
jgi:hypothetical protein